METGESQGGDCSGQERKKKVRRRSTGPDSIAETIKKWKEQNQKLQEENGSRKAPAKGSKKGCMAGKGGPENSNCPYRGVRQRTWGKWVAEIREPDCGNRLWLGSFRTAVEAARAYDEMARAMYGATARVNFSEHSTDANSGCTSAPSLLMSNGPTAAPHPSDENDELESSPFLMSNAPTDAYAKDKLESVETVVHEVKTEGSNDLRNIHQECKTLEVFQPEGNALHKEVNVQSHKPTDSCPQNTVAESSLAVEARDEPNGLTRQSCLSSSGSAPISPIHYEEPKSTLGDGGPISIQKKDPAPRQLKVKQSPFQKLHRLPDRCHPDFDNDHLCSINRLQKFWYKSHAAVLVDDKECVIKTILFTMSVLPDVCQPFIIVTTPASLSLWKDQFNKLAPHINVGVYDGGKDMLKLNKNLGFYENGSHIKSQVLLSHTDAILEDIEPIASICWEAVIVDYYQNSALKYLDQLKKLSTGFRVLLLSSPIKDNLPECMNLLAFLNSGEKDNSDHIDSADALEMSKIRFKRHIAYERKADSSNFLEYWVPAYISQVQLEIYCSILLSNSSVLQSQMKTDSGEALHDILLSLSKCCNHPYLVDKCPQTSLVNNHDVTETVDTRVHASGKLLLLDKMLKEISNKRLRVIILFQSGGAGANPVGDILEGVVRHRFGPESYERVKCGAVMSSKLAAINMFNDKTKGRFVFLIESRACLPSIKLLSIDAIFIYGSDWNPQNDLKALQKINIESQRKNVSIFRLYTPFTVEEKSFMVAKQGMLIDRNIQDVMRSLSHSLISWGAEFLFTTLDELQKNNYASKRSETDTVFMDGVISEFLTELPANVEDSTKINSSSISKANLSGEFYSRHITLIGEKKGMSELDGDPSKFWLNLLGGKSPCWSYLSEPPQSSNRMLQNSEEPAKVAAEKTDEARRKRRKVGEIMGSSSEDLLDHSPDDMLPKNCSTSSLALQPLDDTPQKLGVKNLMSTPKNLHLQLKQELSKIIEVLQLPANVSLLVKTFFEYLLENHLVVQEPEGIMVFNIALCWCAASLLNYKVDHRESLALVEKCLNYECNEELAEFMYEKLGTLKKKFPHEVGETSSKCQPMSVKNTELQWQETSTNLRNDRMLPKRAMDLHGNFTNGAPQEDSSGAEQMVSEGQELISIQENHRECDASIDELPNMVVEKRIDLVDNVCSFREKNILHKQQLEISDLVTHTQKQIPRFEATQTCESNMSAQQCTSLPAQQCLVTSRHPPADAEPAGIFGTEAARGLQAEMQPSTSKQDQPTEAERACTLGAPAAQDLQPEMQPSPSMQDVPLERANLSRMPGLESINAHQSVEPSWDPHAGIGPTGTLGMVTTHDLQSEIQQSASIQDRPAGAEGTGTLGTTAVQNSQPEMQSSATTQHVPLETTHSEDRSQIGFQPNTASGPEQPTQLLPVASDEPPKNELERLKYCSNLLSKTHEQKISQLLIEYNQETEKINRRYGLLLQKEDSAYLQSKVELVDTYRKAYINQSSAQGFRGNFAPSSAAQGGSKSPAMEQPLQSSSAAHTTASLVASSSAIRPPVLTSLHSTGPYVQPLPGNLYGATSPLSIPTPLPHGSYGAAGALSLPVSPGVTLSRQFVPGIMENSALAGPQAGATLTSMRPSSVDQTMLPASNPFPAFPVSSLPPGLSPEYMVFLRSVITGDHILTAAQQSPSLNIVSHSTSGPLNAAALGSQLAGAQIAGVNQSSDPGGVWAVEEAARLSAMDNSDLEMS